MLNVARTALDTGSYTVADVLKADVLPPLGVLVRVISIQDKVTAQILPNSTIDYGA